MQILTRRIVVILLLISVMAASTGLVFAVDELAPKQDSGETTENESTEEPAQDHVDESLSAPVITSFKRLSQNSMQIKWNGVGGISGYEIEVDTTSNFNSSNKRIFTTSAGTVTKNVAGLLSNTKYFVRIRTYTELPEGNKKFSKWYLFKDIKKNFTANVTRLKLKKKNFDINAFLPRRYGRNNFVLQGCTTDGSYNYYILNKSGTQKCIIVKTNAKTNKKVKISKYLTLNHANDVTYNPDTGHLYVVNSEKYPMRITTVNRKTLKIVGKKNIKIPANLPGSTEAQRKTTKALVSIAYSNVRKQYAVRISMKDDFLILDQKLRPVKYVKAKFYVKQCSQGFDCDADYIYLFCDAVQKKYNMIYVMDWDGNLVQTIRIKCPYEIESVFHRGGVFYATFHHGRMSRGRYMRSSYAYKISGM